MPHIFAGMDTPRQADINAALREAIKLIRAGGWQGHVESEVEITNGRFIIRARPAATPIAELPPGPPVSPPKDDEGPDADAIAQEVMRKTARRVARRLDAAGRS